MSKNAKQQLRKMQEEARGKKVEKPKRTPRPKRPTVEEQFKLIQPILQYCTRYLLGVATTIKDEVLRKKAWKAAEEVDMALAALGCQSAVFSELGLQSAKSVHAKAGKALDTLNALKVCPICDKPLDSK